MPTFFEKDRILRICRYIITSKVVVQIRWKLLDLQVDFVYKNIYWGGNENWITEIIITTFNQAHLKYLDFLMSATTSYYELKKKYSNSLMEYLIHYVRDMCLWGIVKEIIVTYDDYTFGYTFQFYTKTEEHQW